MDEERGKYLISARIEADGVIERSDVVGAIFGQTEGLLGDRLELRSLQESERVGRLEVEVTSSEGRSTGQVEIATSLDRVETAIIAAALETIEQIGPCRASVYVERIEDVRAAKRQDVVDRARELLAVGFEDSGLSAREVIERVRRDAQIYEITEVAGAPAGPEVETSNDVILVEGRADVRRLLEYGINNAVGVEGTNVRGEIVELTRDRTVTAFFDGDRGGNLLLFELAQVGDVDYVTFAPPGRSVEDLSRSEVHTALEERVPYEQAETDGTDEGFRRPNRDQGDQLAAADIESREAQAVTQPVDDSDDVPPDLRDHIRAVIGEESDRARLIDAEYGIMAEADGEDVRSLLDDSDETAYALIVDATIEQATIDKAARLDLDRIVATRLGQFTKRPTDVRVHAATDVIPDLEAPAS